MEKKLVPDLLVTRKTKKRIAKQRIFNLSELLDATNPYNGKQKNNRSWGRAVVA